MNRIDKAIFEFAYRMALDDATAQQAYKGRGKGSKLRLRECGSAKQSVKKYIEAIFDPAGEPDFEKAITDVEKAFDTFLTKDGDGVFTFGNAQKLINMTAKYMFMATYEKPELRVHFDACHCPMDNIIVDKVIDLVSKNMPTEGRLAKELNEKHECRDKKRSKWSVYLKQPWSGITEDSRQQYDLYQELVRYLCSLEDLNLSPIEFDFIEW